MVQSWARRYPSNKNRLQMINAMTFAAIIRRNGGPFTSNAGGKQTFYHWMEDLYVDSVLGFASLLLP